MKQPPTVKLGLPRGLFVRVDRLATNSTDWNTVRVHLSTDAADIVLADNETLSCGCGSYAYGECELCANEAVCQ